VKKQIPGWAVLLIITLVAGLALGATYSVTKDTIDQQAIVSAENARKAALPAADSFVELDLNIRSASKQGFAGPVYAELTLDESGKIATLKIGNDAFAETPGFGAKALEESFAAQFIGKATALAQKFEAHTRHLRIVQLTIYQYIIHFTTLLYGWTTVRQRATLPARCRQCNACSPLP